jgi:hypothetical protein
MNRRRRPGDQGGTFDSTGVLSVTPLDLSNLWPHLVGAWATGLIWVGIQFARRAWRGALSGRSVRLTLIEGVCYACALSVCAISIAAYSNHLISHGVEGLVMTMIWVAMAGSGYACDRSGPELEFSGGTTSSDSGS